MNLIRTNNRTFDRFFDDFFQADYANFHRNGGGHRVAHAPKVNISHDENGYLVQMAAPGWKKSDFNIELDKEVLTISAEREAQKDAKELNFSKREFTTASFSRAFRLPDTVASDKITAEYEDGILAIQLPKKEEAKPIPARTISIA